jgi:uncharacterized membrane protein
MYGERRRNCSLAGVTERERPPNPAADNVRAIVELERKALEATNWPDRISGAVSAFVGNLRFVFFQVVLFISWAAWNALASPSLRFDPHPYGLLTFIVSIEGVLIATFVLIKQNRMAAQTDQRDHLNLQIDLLAEQEMTAVLRMLQRISEQLGVPSDDADDARTQKLAEETNVHELMHRLEKELPTD